MMPRISDGSRDLVVVGFIVVLLVIVGMCNSAHAEDGHFQRKYWSAATVEALALTADGVTTLQLIGPREVCHTEGGTPWLYGRRPAAGREAGTMAGEFALSLASSYLAHKLHVRWWAAPMVGLSLSHTWGTVHNLEECR